jgi:hypothetical protein
MDFALKDDTLARLTANGVKRVARAERAAGSLQRPGGGEDADGKMAAHNQTVEIPK